MRIIVRGVSVTSMASSVPSVRLRDAAVEGAHRHGEIVEKREAHQGKAEVVAARGKGLVEFLAGNES